MFVAFKVFFSWLGSYKFPCFHCNTELCFCIFVLIMAQEKQKPHQDSGRRKRERASWLSYETAPVEIFADAFEFEACLGLRVEIISLTPTPKAKLHLEP